VADDETLESERARREATAPLPTDLIGRVLLHFRVLERLGGGGMGVVYRAFDTKLRREIALKILSPRYLADDRNRGLIFREARSAAALTHPNIAAIYDVHDVDSIAFIAMELVDGETLRARLSRGPLPVVEAMRIGAEIARGLVRAHQQGIVHRDLKPENVMLTRDGHVKLLDFGLAKVAQEEDPVARGETSGDAATMPASPSLSGGRVMGTPAYMSPEQARGDRVDLRTDVFAFGALMYELLAGAAPFRHRTSAPHEWRVDAGDWQARPPLRAVRRVPRELDRMIGRCLEPERDRRPASARDLVDALSARPTRWSWAIALAVVAVLAVIVLWPRGHDATVATYHEQRLTHRGDVRETAILSPDGRHVADIVGTELLLFDIERPEAEPVVLDADVSSFILGLAWASDGKHLTYVSDRGVKRYPTDGGAGVDVDGWPIGPEGVVAKKGKDLVVGGIRCPIASSYASTWVLGAYASDDVYIGLTEDDFTDATQVFHTDRRCSHGEIIARGLDLTSAAIAGDGVSLLGFDRGTRGGRIVRIGPEGTLHELFRSDATYGVAGERSDGTLVVVAGESSWRLVRLHDGAQTELASGSPEAMIDLNADGTRFARLDFTAHGGALAVYEVGRPSQIVHPIETSAVAAALAPDGERLAAIVRVADAKQLVVESLDGGHRVTWPITGNAMNSWLLWTGASTVAFPLAELTFREVNVETGVTRDLVDNELGPIRGPFAAPDVNKLAGGLVEANHQWGLYVWEPGQPRRRIADVPHFVGSYTWSRDGTALYSYAYIRQQTEIDRIDLASGIATPYAKLAMERNTKTMAVYALADGDLVAERHSWIKDLALLTPQ
jgi:hypothetical protein